MRPKILFGMPSMLGRPRVETLVSIVPTITYMKSKGWDVSFGVVTGNPVDVARREIVDAADKWGADYVAMFDDDMAFHQDVFERLIDNNVDVCVPLMSGRRPPYYMMAFDLVKKDETKAIWKDEYKSKHRVKRGLDKCDGIGMGVVIMKREIFSRLPKPYFVLTPNKQGEDLYFSSLAKLVGVDLYYDGRIEVEHYGDPIAVTPQWVMNLPDCPYTMEEANA